MRGLFSMEVIVVATCCRSSSLRCKSLTELLLLLTQPSSSLLYGQVENDQELFLIYRKEGNASR